MGRKTCQSLSPFSSKIGGAVKPQGKDASYGEKLVQPQNHRVFIRNHSKDAGGKGGNHQWRKKQAQLAFPLCSEDMDKAEKQKDRGGRLVDNHPG